jgi:cell division protein FtsL
MEIQQNLKLYLDHLMIYLGKLEGTVKFIFYSALVMLAFRFEYSMIIMVIMLALLIFFIEIHKNYKKAFFRRQLEEFKQKIKNESIQPYNYHEQFNTIDNSSQVYDLSKASEIDPINLG